MNKMLTYVMAMLIITAAAFIVYWFLIETPNAQRAQDLNQGIEGERNKAATYKKDEKEIKKVEEDILKVKEEIFNMLCKAKGRSLEQFLKEVEEDSNSAGVNLESIRIESVVPKELAARIPLDFNLSATYFNLYDFLLRIQDRNKLDFSSSSLTLTLDGNRREKISNLVKLVDTQKSKYDATKDQFPRLRVTLTGDIVVIEPSQLERYKPSPEKQCAEAPGEKGGEAPAGGD